jgi:hypothetical protein
MISSPTAEAPETAERIRLTISVTPEVHAAFSRLAKALDSSIGREMGTFLHDCLDAVDFVADKVEQARAAPRLVAREMHAYALGLADETGALLKQMAAGGSAAAAQAKRDGAAEPPAARSRRSAKPPSSPTGVNTPPRKARK